MLKFNLQKVNYQKAEDKPGLYLLKFPNEMNYVGSSMHIKERLREHYSNFFKERRTDAKWYIDAKTMIEKYASEQGITYANGVWRSIQIYVQYTSTKEEAKELEKQALHDITKNNFQSKYYNTYFK